MSNEYKQRQEARRERLLERSEEARNKAKSVFQQVNDLGRYCPPGQPILVGHHSERRHRSHLASMDRMDRKGFAEIEKSQELEKKAAAVGTGGIASDDPEAIDKLREQLSSLQAQQALMKAANAALRKSKTPEAKIQSLLNLGIPEAEAQQLIVPRFGTDGGFPSYKLTNNNANIRRIKLRVEELEKMRAEPFENFECDDYTYCECDEEGRVLFTFPSKPSSDVRGILIANGFKWSPSREAWTRVLSSDAKSAGKYVRSVLDLLIITAT